MKSFKILFFLCLFSSNGDAGNWKNLNQGDQTAEEFLNKLEDKKKEAGPHPFSQGISKEAGFQEQVLEDTSKSLFQTDSASQMILESLASRPQIKMDLTHDPLLAKSQKIMENPLTEIGGKGTHASQSSQGGEDEILTCEEGGEDVQHTCVVNKSIKIVEEKGNPINSSFDVPGCEVYGSHPHFLSFQPVAPGRVMGYISSYPPLVESFITPRTGIPVEDIIVFSAGNNGLSTPLTPGYFLFERYHFCYTYRPRVKVPQDFQVNGCEALEAKADQGLCSYVSKVCSQGPQTRVFEGIAVTKKCWQYTYTYQCYYPSKDDCGPLRARGCVQINSSCKQYVGKTCVLYTQTYQCKGENRPSSSIQGGKPPFCLDGTCRNQTWENNDELMSSLAQLSLLKELQGQFQNGILFKGEDHRCSKQPLNFKDCCGSGKGWGNDLGFSSCSAKEKALSQKRKKGLCHFVGTYCDKKVLGKCIKKKSSYCCFTNKLLKAFHEQGRPQIGLGWGSGKEPLCRGFTIEEIQRVDFSKLDLREVFEDLMKNYAPGKTQNIGQKVNERLETIKQVLIPKATQQPKQRDAA